MKNSCLLIAALVAIALGVGANPVDPCQGQPNGKLVQIRCKEYHVCQNNATVVTPCLNDKNFDRDTKQCLPYGQGNNACPPPAGDCSNGRHGLYPDSLNCYTFYHCNNGSYVPNSHTYCQEPLLFNAANGLCDWAFNVNCGGSGR